MEIVTVAHRAGNSLEALRRAEAAGAGLVEVDVHLFRGRLEARHLKTVGPLPLYWDRWELRPPSTPIVRLEELVAASRSPLLVDLKGGARRLGREVSTALAGVRGGHETWVCTRRWRHLEELRETGGLRLVASIGSEAQLGRFFRRYGPGAVDGVSVHRRLLDSPAVIERLRSRTDVLFTWRVNDLAVAADLYRRGVGGFISDHYDLLPSLAALALPVAE